MVDTSNKEISLERKLKSRAKRQSIKIDMTPMVDLAFLLLTFFILTTTLAQQKSIDLILPSEGESDPVNNAITVILSDKNKLFYYIGELHDTTTLKETNFKEIRRVILLKNQVVVKEYNAFLKQHSGVDFDEDSVAKIKRNKILSNKNGAFVIIKYDNKASYRNVIDIIDEMEACAIPMGRYAIVKKLEIQEENRMKKVAKLTVS